MARIAKKTPTKKTARKAAPKKATAKRVPAKKTAVRKAVRRDPLKTANRALTIAEKKLGVAQRALTRATAVRDKCATRVAGIKGRIALKVVAA